MYSLQKLLQLRNLIKNPVHREKLHLSPKYN